MHFQLLCITCLDLPRNLTLHWISAKFTLHWSLFWFYPRHPNYFGEIFQWWFAWALAYNSSEAPAGCRANRETMWLTGLEPRHECAHRLLRNDEQDLGHSFYFQENQCSSQTWQWDPPFRWFFHWKALFLSISQKFPSAWQILTGYLDPLWWSCAISPIFTMLILLHLKPTGIYNAEGKNLKRYYDQCPATWRQHAPTCANMRQPTFEHVWAMTALCQSSNIFTIFCLLVPACLGGIYQVSREHFHSHSDDWLQVHSSACEKERRLWKRCNRTIPGMTMQRPCWGMLRGITQSAQVQAIFSFPTHPTPAFQDHILRVQEVRIQSKGCRRSEERVRRRVTKKHKKKNLGVSVSISICTDFSNQQPEGQEGFSSKTGEEQQGRWQECRKSRQEAMARMIIVWIWLNMHKSSREYEIGSPFFKHWVVAQLLVPLNYIGSPMLWSLWFCQMILSISCSGCPWRIIGGKTHKQWRWVTLIWVVRPQFSDVPSEMIFMTSWKK